MAPFLKTAAFEALEQIERLRQHPCIALWCGNNENDEAWHNWGWQMQFNEAQRTQIWREYKLLFNDILRTYVENNAGGVPYWESSPRYGRANPKSLTEGDSHYWGVWHDEEPFRGIKQKSATFHERIRFSEFPGVAHHPIVHPARRPKTGEQSHAFAPKTPARQCPHRRIHEARLQNTQEL
jgi:beta-mannosidase